MLHILNNVAVPKGAVVNNGKEHYTLYSACIDVNAQIYYYRTYNFLDTKIIDASHFDRTDNRLAIISFI